jgi:hypothetical protein
VILPKQSSDLHHALTELLLPISTLLISNGIGFSELLQASKQAYVRAAIKNILAVGARANTSRLSVVTGLTRKEVSMLLKEIQGSRVKRVRRGNEQRALRVVRGWLVDDRFLSRSGRAASIPLKGARGSFPQLVRLYGGDVTPNAVLKELQRMEAVSITSEGNLRLNSTWTQQKPLQQLSRIARLVADFVEILKRCQSATDVSAYFGAKEFSVHSVTQSARFHRVFSKRANALLQSVDQWLATQTPRKQSRRRCANTSSSVGVGVYLIQKNAEEAVKLRT